MPVRCSYKLSHWSSGIGAEDRWYISTDIVQFSDWIFFVVGAEALTILSTEVLFSSVPVNWVTAASLHELSETRQGLTGNISSSGTKKLYHVSSAPVPELLQKESCSKCFACLRLKL